MRDPRVTQWMAILFLIGLAYFDPVTEDWHCLVSLSRASCTFTLGNYIILNSHFQVVWKMYGQSSKDHGTLRYFQSLLNGTTVKSDAKKAVQDP